MGQQGQRNSFEMVERQWPSTMQLLDRYLLLVCLLGRIRWVTLGIAAGYGSFRCAFLHACARACSQTDSENTFFSVQPQWISYFDNPQGSRLGLMACVQSIGYIPGGPVSAILADRFGRRWAIITGALILSAGLDGTRFVSERPFIFLAILLAFGSFLQAFATNTSMFTGSR